MAIVKQKTLVQPYLQFNGRTEEAINFYQQAIGAEVTAMMRFSESPEACAASGANPQQVMHSSFRVGETEIMATDGGCASAPAGFQGFSLSLTAPDQATAEKYFQALSQGGQVEMPLAKTFFAEQFGLVRDQFGVSWMILVFA